MTNQTSVSNKAIPATSWNSQAFTAKQTSASIKANPTTWIFAVVQVFKNYFIYPAHLHDHTKAA